MDRKKYLDGVKGIACFIVAMNHFSNLYLINMNNKWFPYIRTALTNGGYMVYIFCGLSFFLASLIYFNKSDSYDLGKSAMKRYCKLVLPIFFLCFIIFILNKLGAFQIYYDAMGITKLGDKAINYHIDYSLRQLITAPFFNVVFKQTNDFTFVLWMIYHIFLGYFWSVLVSMIIKNRKVLQATAMIIFIVIISFHFFNTFVLLSTICVYIAYLYKKNVFRKYKSLRICGTLLIICGVLADFEPLNKFLLKSWLYSYIYVIGTVCIISGLLMLENAGNSIIIKVLESRPFQFIGENSYAVYLIYQPITTTVCAFMYCIVYGRIHSLYITTLLVLIAYLIIILVGSDIWRLTVEKLCAFITQKTVSWMGKQENKLLS